MKYGDEVAIERSDGYSRFGTYLRSDDEYIHIKGTVGDNIGKRILIPKAHILQITVLQTARQDFR